MVGLETFLVRNLENAVEERERSVAEESAASIGIVLQLGALLRDLDETSSRTGTQLRKRRHLFLLLGKAVGKEQLEAENKVATTNILIQKYYGIVVKDVEMKQLFDECRGIIAIMFAQNKKLLDGLLQLKTVDNQRVREFCDTGDFSDLEHHLLLWFQLYDQKMQDTTLCAIYVTDYFPEKGFPQHFRFTLLQCIQDCSE